MFQVIVGENVAYSGADESRARYVFGRCVALYRFLSFDVTLRQDGAWVASYYARTTAKGK